MSAKRREGCQGILLDDRVKPRKREDLSCYTASDWDVKLNSFSFNAGSNEPPPPSELPTRSGFPIASTFPGASILAVDWLNRKFFNGYAILPFSIHQTPSRVSPV